MTDQDKEIKEVLAMLGMDEDGQRLQVARYITPKPWLHTFTEKHIDRPNPKWIISCRKCQHKWELLGYNIEQVLAEENKIREKECPYPDPLGSDSLADLAFRMRDETKHLQCYGYFFEAREIICCKMMNYYKREREEDGITRSSLHDAGIWFTKDAQPIHWIAAALIAKILAKDKDAKNRDM